jgi:hypothetical protein
VRQSEEDLRVDRQRLFHEAIAVSSVALVGILGLMVTGTLQSVTSVPTQAPLVWWGLWGISTALTLVAILWILAIRARIRRAMARQ